MIHTVKAREGGQCSFNNIANMMGFLHANEKSFKKVRENGGQNVKTDKENLLNKVNL
jgi:hypothetical protein